jgi:hypothetical protein
VPAATGSPVTRVQVMCHVWAMNIPSMGSRSTLPIRKYRWQVGLSEAYAKELSTILIVSVGLLDTRVIYSTTIIAVD